MSFGLSAIGQIAVTVADVDRAIAFYRDTLGLPLLYQFPGMGFFDCGGVRLMLSNPEGVGAGNSVLYFKVADLDEAFGELGRRGVQFEQEPHIVARLPDHNLWMAFFRDPEGNLLGLMSEVAR